MTQGRQMDGLLLALNPYGRLGFNNRRAALVGRIPILRLASQAHGLPVRVKS